MASQTALTGLMNKAVHAMASCASMTKNALTVPWFAIRLKIVMMGVMKGTVGSVSRHYLKFLNLNYL